MINILKKFEDPKRPFMGPNIKALKFWGLLLSKSNPSNRNLQLLIYFLVTLFVATEYIDIWFVKADLNLLLNNMKVTMLATMSIVKLTTFYYWQDRWWSVINYITNTDLAQRTTTNIKKIEIINKFTKYARKITFGYWFLVYTTICLVIIYPLLKYLFWPSYRQNTKNGIEPYFEVVSAWVPWDKSTIPGYLAASVYQGFASCVGGGWITSFDSSAIVIMIFFRVELELLKIDCTNIFGTDESPVDDKVALERLKDCHRRHVELMKHTRIFDACLSPIMLCYMIICSVMLCVTAYQIMSETSAVQRFVFIQYLVMCIAQLFSYCWHSNEVLFASQDLKKAPFESKWYIRGLEHKKNLYILTEQYSNTVAFSVGPFTKLTVATFIQILKAAYSYYTLLYKSTIK